MHNEIIHSNLDSLHGSDMLVYGDNRIALIERQSSIKLLNPVRMEVLISVVCLSGKSTFALDGTLYEISKNDMLTCHPRSIIATLDVKSPDFDIRGVCLSQSYIKQLPLLPRNIWNIIQYLEKTPIKHLSDNELETFLRYYDLLRVKLLGKHSDNSDEIIDLLTQAAICEIRDIFAPCVKSQPIKYTSSNSLFTKFMEIVSSSAQCERTVSYYADRLHVSPKYLSAVCKEVSGHTASAIISACVMKEVERLLKMSNMSIKEIANELNFSSISFFGKYVRKKLGMSPKHYREMLARGERPQCLPSDDDDNL